MMIVDTPHRRDLTLLTSFFKGQFFIPTHEQTWAMQLQSEWFIPVKNWIEFSDH